MKSGSPLLCVLMLMTLFAAPDSPGDSLRTTLAQYSACWESRNQNGCLDRFLATNYTRVNRNGLAGNADTLRATFRELERSGRSGGWRFDTAHIRIYGETALVTQSVAMPLGGGSSNGVPVEHHQTMVWIRERGVWKVVREYIYYQISPAKPQ